MKTARFLLCLAVLGAALSHAVSAQKPAERPSNSPGVSEAIVPPPGVIHDDLITLVRARDYKDMKQTVDCPNCKDLFCATFSPSHAGEKILDVSFIRMRSKGHWYRCQWQSSCGRPEFSNPSDPRFGCVGQTSCQICRAVDGTEVDEDDIVLHSSR